MVSKHTLHEHNGRATGRGRMQKISYRDESAQKHIGKQAELEATRCFVNIFGLTSIEASIHIVHATRDSYVTFTENQLS